MDHNNKPYHGIIESWRQVPTDASLGYMIAGQSVGHPAFHGEAFQTQPVIAREGDQIETINDWYTLGSPDAQPD